MKIATRLTLLSVLAVPILLTSCLDFGKAEREALQLEVAALNQEVQEQEAQVAALNDQLATQQEELEHAKGQVENANKQVLAAKADLSAYQRVAGSRGQDQGNQIAVLTLTNGSAYRGVTLRRFLDTALVIEHDGGVDQIDYNDLDEEMRERYQFVAAAESPVLAATTPKARQSAIEVAAENQKLSSAEARIIAREGELSAKEREYEEVKQKRDAKNAEIAEVAEKTTKARSARAEAQKVQDLMQRQVNDAQTRMQNMSQGTGNVRRSAADVKRDQDKMQAAITQAQGLLAEKKAVVSAAEAEVNDLLTVQRALTTEIAVLDQQVAKFEGEIRKMRAAIENDEEKRDAISIELQKKQAEARAAAGGSK